MSSKKIGVFAQISMLIGLMVMLYVAGIVSEWIGLQWWVLPVALAVIIIYTGIRFLDKAVGKDDDQ